MKLLCGFKTVLLFFVSMELKKGNQEHGHGLGLCDEKDLLNGDRGEGPDLSFTQMPRQ